MELKTGDFVEIEFDLYANGSLVQTTDEKKGKEANLNIKEYKPQSIILGKSFILKALDDDIIKNKKESNTLNLKTEEAYGKRKKDLLKTLPKSAFEEHKTRPVPGVTYDFNGMYGTVKSVIGGRVLVDFNNPLSGKEIKITYNIMKKIEDVCEKVKIIMKTVLSLTPEMFKVDKKEKDLILQVPMQLNPLEKMLKQTIQDFIPETKDLNIKIENFKKKENS